MTNEYQQRPFDARELQKQIGLNNLFAISGGRILAVRNEDQETVEVILPVGKGYRVAITLGYDDTYIVRREFVRGGKVFTKGVQKNVYFDEVGDVAYYASCFVNVDFPLVESAVK